MKLVVTGSDGGLARAFLAQVPGHHDVIPLSRGELDVGDHHAVMRAIPPLAPDAILSFGAMTDVDRCELEPEDAYRTNALGPHSLALAARKCGGTIVHVSTDYVFDGTKGGPYDEQDAPAPLSVYGRSKLGGELHVVRTTPEHFIVRTAYVFGAGDDYLSRSIDRLAHGESVGGLTDRTGSFTAVWELAARVLPLLLTGRFGTHHVAGSEPATWHDVLSRAAALGDLPGTVVAQTQEELALPARRPRDSSLISLSARELGIAPMPTLDVSLKELLDGRH